MEDKHSVVIEEYLQLIYQYQQKRKGLKAVTLAERLQTSPTTVHATLQRMQRDQLITVGEKKSIKLTPAGEKLAANVAFRHNVAEYFLCNTLGIPWYEVHQHAHRLEHAMTPLVVEKLVEFLGYPESCPHGSPMPGNFPELLKDCFPLDEAQQGWRIKVVMLDESLEDSVDLLKHLYTHQVVPGQSHDITERVEATSSLTLAAKGTQVVLPFNIARFIKVVRAEVQ